VFPEKDRPRAAFSNNPYSAPLKIHFLNSDFHKFTGATARGVK
jgi:hypothetical protein